MYGGLPGTPTPTPLSADTRGRGRGRGLARGSGTFRSHTGPTEQPEGVDALSFDSKKLVAPPAAVRGRHSSYIPSSRAIPISSNPASREAPQPVARRGRGGAVPTESKNQSPGTRSTSYAAGQSPINKISPRAPIDIPRAPVRAVTRLPKFSDIDAADDDEPTPPPRSPHVSPRAASLPPLPARPNQRLSAVAAISVPATTSEGASSPDKDARQAEMRRKCVQEIHQTEKDYIIDLETIINVFIFPLRTMAAMDEKSLYNVFSNVEVLINCNKEMLDQLEQIIKTTCTGGDVTLGHVFTQLADYFKMYKVFCANQTNSLSTVELLSKKNTQFKKILDTCHSDPRCRGLFLQSFLIKPIQRVCKYPLLLRELIRYTPESHPDWDPLQAAFSKINGVVADINEAQRQAEGLQRILDLQNLIEGVENLVAPGRNYVKEGEMTFYKTPKSKTGEKRIVFFFTDLILLTLKRGEKRFEHKLSIDLDSCTLVVLADTPYIKNSFELQDLNLKGKKCILSGETADQSNLWIREIRGLMKSYQKRKLREMEEAKRKGLTPIAGSYS